MHNIFLGILKFHGQTVFGLKAPKEEKTISDSPLEAKSLGSDQLSASSKDEDIFVQTELRQTLGILLEEIVDSDSASDLSYIPNKENNSNASDDCFTDTNDSDDEPLKNPKGLFGMPVVGILCYGKNKRSQEILDNFLHLISAANIIRQSEIHLRKIKTLRLHIQKYLKSLATIFPSIKY
ncbi:hypothetical protein PCASD_23555 [Puccinia coronata f. sp. avenae]|uniref:Uncharacterized protein n=1 Tax=Puccinia coronata f. sp. avenae TaxID=200324 RepID=A0A2N5SBX3_9BASI|nr:hypothetical protein PCASD_23555 [Puccinia coronata f. sp. avenae]